MNTKLRSPSARILAVAVFIGAASLVMSACTIGPGNDKPWMAVVPNTEDISGSWGAMFVSPNDEWVTFFTASDGGFADGLASVELAAGRRVEHHLREIPGADMEGFGPEPFLAMQTNRGFHTGWFQGKLYMPNPARPRKALVISNAEPAISWGPMPREHLMMSDGPGWTAWQMELKERLDRPTGGLDVVLLSKYSAAWRDSGYGSTTYLYDRTSRSFLAMQPGGERRPIVRLPSGTVLEDVSVAVVRISPDERFLAYVVSYRSRTFPSPIQRDVLMVTDLTAGVTRSICSFRAIGDIYWSAKGPRLILTGVNSTSDRGAYIADVAGAFSRSRN